MKQLRQISDLPQASQGAWAEGEMKSSDFLEICMREESQQSKAEGTMAQPTLGYWSGSLFPVQPIAM